VQEVAVILDEDENGAIRGVKEVAAPQKTEEF
jgi:hypothetical protein